MKILKLLVFAVPVFAYSQTQPLKNNFKVEAGFQGLNLGYELPVSPKFLIDLNAGVGGAVKINSNGSEKSIQYVVAENNEFYISPFIRAQLRYYFNREKRADRGHSLLNNSGSFFGLQSKAVFNKTFGNTLVSDLHFGQQLPLGSHFIFRYHAGIGLGVNLAESIGMPYPAFGASLGYCF